MPLVVCACLTSLSLDAAGVDPVIWKDGDQIVQLVRQDDPSAPSNAHPADLSAAEIEAVLESLRLRYAHDDDEPSLPVFTPDEVDNLSKALATGLGAAAPSQDVIFHVVGAHRVSRGLFARRNRVSAGRVFVSDGGLNVIFGQIQTPYRKRNVYGQIDEDFSPRNYGSRIEATAHDVILLTSAAGRLLQNGVETRNDWVIVDPRLTAGGQGAASSPPSTPAAADIERRLQALKQLRDRELISEQAYQARMKEILQEL